MKKALKLAVSDAATVPNGAVAVIRPPRMPASLNSIEAARRELARLYRAARSGEIETSEASRLTYMLSELVKMLTAGKLEARLTALEGAARDDEGGSDGEVG